MFLQGDLQKVFDALYHMGVIDPVLDMDWSDEFARLEKNPIHLVEVIKVVNGNNGDHYDLMDDLCEFGMKDLSHLAMLVAKELAGFQTVETLH